MPQNAPPRLTAPLVGSCPGPTGNQTPASSPTAGLPDFPDLKTLGLSPSDLSSTDLRPADFSSTDFSSADLSSTDLSSAVFYSPQSSFPDPAGSPQSPEPPQPRALVGEAVGIHLARQRTRGAPVALLTLLERPAGRPRLIALAPSDTELLLKADIRRGDQIEVLTQNWNQSSGSRPLAGPWPANPTLTPLLGREPRLLARRPHD
jgi:hypothetical protein